jgi:DNA-binding NarL/FixJ family response regulator
MPPPAVQVLTVAVISSHTLVWLGWQKLFETRETPQVVVHLYQRMTPDVLLPEHHPNVTILDMETVRDVIGAIRQMKEADLKSKILLLSEYEDKERTREAVEYGVDGVVLKTQPPTVMLAAIDALYPPLCNRVLFEPDGAKKTINASAGKGSQPAVWPEELTEREREVIVLVRQGLSNKDIAYQLSISDSTVRHHLTSIFDKVGVPNRQKLLVHAHRVHSTPD